MHHRRFTDFASVGTRLVEVRAAPALGAMDRQTAARLPFKVKRALANGRLYNGSSARCRGLSGFFKKTFRAQISKDEEKKQHKDERFLTILLFSNNHLLKKPQICSIQSTEHINNAYNNTL